MNLHDFFLAKGEIGDIGLDNPVHMRIYALMLCFVLHEVK
jgi:hypothetical protein